MSSPGGSEKQTQDYSLARDLNSRLTDGLNSKRAEANSFIKKSKPNFQAGCPHRARTWPGQVAWAGATDGQEKARHEPGKTGAQQS